MVHRAQRAASGARGTGCTCDHGANRRTRTNTSRGRTQHGTASPPAPAARHASLRAPRAFRRWGANTERHNSGQQTRRNHAAGCRERASRRRGNGPSRPHRASAGGRASGETPTKERPEKGRRGAGVNMCRPCACAARYAGPTEPARRKIFAYRIVADEWPLLNFDARQRVLARWHRPGRAGRPAAPARAKRALVGLLAGDAQRRRWLGLIVQMPRPGRAPQTAAATSRTECWPMNLRAGGP